MVGRVDGHRGREGHARARGVGQRSALQEVVAHAGAGDQRHHVAVAAVGSPEHDACTVAARGDVNVEGVVGPVAAGLRDGDAGPAVAALAGLDLQGPGQRARLAPDPLRAAPVVVAQAGLEGRLGGPGRGLVGAVPGADRPLVRGARLQLGAGVVDVGLLAGLDLAGVPDDGAVDVLRQPPEPRVAVDLERPGLVLDGQPGRRRRRAALGGLGRRHRHRRSEARAERQGERRRSDAPP